MTVERFTNIVTAVVIMACFGLGFILGRLYQSAVICRLNAKEKRNA